MDQEEIRESITIENQGEKIFGILHRPLFSQRVPAILICPGFEGNKCGKFRIFVNLAKELAKHGIAVLRFDYRGAGDSEGEFNQITLEGKINDTLKCLNFLAEHPQIDSSRIGILGRSLGGAIAVLAAGRYQVVKSLALWAPVFKSDPWRKLWESFQSSPQTDLINNELYQSLPFRIPNHEFVQQFFKLDLATELKALKHVPLLHIHGEQDLIVKGEHARGYEEARGGLSNSRFIQLPRSDHDFSDPSEQRLAVKETCQWYALTL